jgi:hypothetical protein
MGFVLIGIASFTDLGLSGAVLQMVSHGLIGASLFFLVGATYDRTHTLMLDEMGGVGQKMRKIFAMFTTCSMASLALPGMSGFVAELMVFVGFSNSDAYNPTFVDCSLPDGSRRDLNANLSTVDAEGDFLRSREQGVNRSRSFSRCRTTRGIYRRLSANTNYWYWFVSQNANSGV